MKFFLFLTALLITPLVLSSQIIIDSVQAVTPDFMEGAVNDIRFIDENYLLEVGEDGFLRKLDLNSILNIESGITDFQVSDIATLNHISKLGNYIWIAGDDGVVLYYGSMNQIYQLVSGTSNDLTLIENCGDMVCYVDDENNIYSTYDFSEISENKLEAKPNGIYYYKERIYVACDQGVVYYSDNKGESWNKILLDDMQRNLHSVTLGPDEKLYFTGEVFMHTDLNFGNKKVFNIDFQASNIQSISDFQFLSNSMAGAILKDTSDKYSIGIYFESIDTITSIGVNSGTIKPKLTYSSEVGKACIELENERIAVCDSTGFNELFAEEFMEYKYPDLFEVSDIIDIEDNSFTSVRSDILCKTLLPKGTMQEIFNFKNINPNNQTTAYSIAGKSNDRLVLRVDSTYFWNQVNKRTDSKLRYSDDGGYTWINATESDTNLRLLSINQDKIVYAPNDSLFKFSKDGALTWIDIPWHIYESGIAYQLLHINGLTFISNPLFKENPERTDYFKTTDQGASWSRLTWYDTEQGNIFKGSTSQHNFYIMSDDVILYLDPVNNYRLISQDGFESWQEIDILSELDSEIITYGKVDNGNLYVVDAKNIYLSKDNFESVEIIPHTLDQYTHFGETIESTIMNNTIYRNNGRKFVYVKFDKLLSVLDNDDSDFTELSVYPNPASEYIKLSNTDLYNTMGIIVDMNGRKRQLISDLSNNIDISNLESGSYFLIVTDNKGQAYKAKFVISK